MAGAYSTRFFLAQGAGVLTQYTVPTGYVAVVRSVTGTNTGPAAALAWLYVSTRAIHHLPLPASGGSVNLDMRQVADQGQQIAVYTSALEVYVSTSGYLLARGSSGPALGEVTRERVEAVTPLPSPEGDV